jgi:Flp pilus assembly protein TadG
MLLRRRSDEPVSRGQALVEFALVLPILALLLVVAIDFGRVFFGWVSLTNAARIGANFAGYTPNLLTNADDRSDYGDLIADAVTGCNLVPANTDDPAYDPTFSDGNGDTSDGNNDWGDFVTVNIGCEFDLMTPLTEALFSDMVTMRAEAVFPIRSGSFAGPGPGGTPPNPPCTQSIIPDLVNRTLQGAQDKWLQEHFVPGQLTFSPSTATADWLVVGSPPPVFTPSAVINDCVDPATQFVHLSLVAPPPCPATQAQVPDLRGLEFAEARAAWGAAGFDLANFNPSSAAPTTVVLTQVTDPVTSPVIGGCVTITAEVTATFGADPPDPCEVPNMIGMTFAEAQAAWGAGDPHFTGPLTSTGPASGTVHQQVPIHPGRVSCGVTGEVKLRR